jgi:hypothetical protein
VRLYPPRGDALADYRHDLAPIPTKLLLEDAEYWGWELAAFDEDFAADFGDNTVAFCRFKLDEITRELDRRRALATNRHAPPWPQAPAPSLARYDAVKAHYHLAEFIAMVVPCRFTPSADRLVTNCPLGIHDDRTPSFTVWPDQHWYCFGCGMGGSIIDFFMSFYHLDRRAALLAAEEEAGISPGPAVVVHRREEEP